MALEEQGVDIFLGQGPTTLRALSLVVNRLQNTLLSQRKHEKSQKRSHQE